MKDFLNRDLEVGNFVIMTTPKYASLCYGQIIAMTPKNVRVQYTNNWNYAKPGRVDTILVHPSCVVKITDEEAVMLKLENS